MVKMGIMSRTRETTPITFQNPNYQYYVTENGKVVLKKRAELCEEPTVFVQAWRENTSSKPKTRIFTILVWTVRESS